MSFNRYARKKDTTEKPIVKAVRKAGWSVWDRLPVDLLCWKAGKGFRVLECKTPRGKKPKAVIDKRQQDQHEFIALTGTPKVLTAEQALAELEKP